MNDVSWDKLVFTRERIYIFVFFNCLYAFLPFWIIANFVISSPMAFIGLIAYVVAIYCNLTALRWVVTGDYSHPQDENAGVMDRMTLLRLLFGNFIIFLACIFSIGKGQIIVQENYEILPSWLVLIGFVVFIITYVISFFLTYVKSEIETVPQPASTRNLSNEQPNLAINAGRTDNINIQQVHTPSGAEAMRNNPVPTTPQDLASHNADGVAKIASYNDPIDIVKSSVGNHDAVITASHLSGHKKTANEPGKTPKTVFNSMLLKAAQDPKQNQFDNSGSRPNIAEWNVFSDLIPDRKLRNSALSILRRTPDWVNVCPDADLYEKKGSAFFQQAVIRSLGDAQEQATVQFLIELLGKNYDINHGKEAFHRPRWPNIGVDAASSLARIGQPAVEELKKALNAPDPLTRLYAVCGIALLREHSLYSSLAEAVGREADSVVLIYLKRTLAHFEKKEYVPPELDFLKIHIEITRANIKLGEPVKCFWTISNVGPSPLVVNIGSTKVVKQIFSVKALQDQTSIFLSPYDSDSTPGPEDLVILENGQSYRAGPFDLRDHFDISKPGPYEIHGIYRNRFPGIEYGIYVIEGRLASEPAVINIESDSL